MAGIKDVNDSIGSRSALALPSGTAVMLGQQKTG
jgi:hypothetical protein